MSEPEPEEYRYWQHLDEPENVAVPPPLMWEDVRFVLDGDNGNNN